MVILLELLQLFEEGRRYSEREVGDIIAPVHEDFASLRRDLEAREEVSPTIRVSWYLGLRQIDVVQVDAGSRRDRGEDELDPGCASRQLIVADESPRDHDATGSLDDQELSSHGVPCHIDGEPSPGSGVEIGVLPEPGGHPLIGGQVLEHRLRGDCDVDGITELSLDRRPLVLR